MFGMGGIAAMVLPWGAWKHAHGHGGARASPRAPFTEESHAHSGLFSDAPAVQSTVVLICMHFHAQSHLVAPAYADYDPGRWGRLLTMEECKFIFVRWPNGAWTIALDREYPGVEVKKNEEQPRKPRPTA